MLDPQLDAPARDALAQEARGQIEGAGTLKHENTWGLRKMAYEINRRTEADYRWFRFEAPSELLDSLDHNLKIADGVLRFRIFKVDPERAGDRAAPPPPPHRGTARAQRQRTPARTAATPPSTADRDAGSSSACARSLRVFAPRGGESRAAALLDWSSTNEFRGVRALAASNVNVVVITGNLTRDPELRTHRRRDVGLRASRRGQQPAQRLRAANGSTSPTTSTWPSGARRARTARTTSPRAVRWRSKGASTGASGRPKTAAANARRCRSSPTASSSSARATAPAAAAAATATAAASRPTSDVPADTSDFEGAGRRRRWRRRRRHSLLATLERLGGAACGPAGGVACSDRSGADL